MVQLIRLVNNENKVGYNEGNLECEFDSEIKVKPKSKIALHSAVFEAIERQFEVFSNNNEVNITYATNPTPIQATVQLTNNIYDSNNIDFFYQDITNKFNLSVPYDNKTLGSEWLCEKQEHNNKVGITYKRVQRTVNPDVKKNISFSNNRIKRNGGVSGTDDSYAGSDGFICRGVGQYYVTNANKVKQPFFMGVMNDTIENKIDADGDLGIENILYGFQYDGNVSFTQIVNGVATGAPFTWGFVEKPSVEVLINTGKINLNFYDAAKQAGLEFNYNGSDKLYPVCVIDGTSAIELTFSAAISGFSNLSAGVDEVDEGLLASPDAQQRNNDNLTVVFQSNLLAQFLGYNDGNIGSFPNSGLISNILFQAASYLLLNVKSDSFLVELMNTGLNVSSYDAQLKKRFPILGVIPSAEISEIAHAVVYEAKNLIYLDIDNIDEIYIRNISVRLLNSDLSPVLTRGGAFITILIKDTNE